MTELDLDAIEARAGKRSDPNRGSINDLVRLQDVDGRLVAVWRREFVDNAHDDVAALVARVRELEAERDEDTRVMNALRRQRDTAERQVRRVLELVDDLPHPHLQRVLAALAIHRGDPS